MSKAREPAQESLLDFTAADHQAGFRLVRFELFNWGTFHQKIWSIAPEGNNALLTGDIGSGKSTLVDGLTTLLIPGVKITYNKAAGAQSKERNLASYVRGHYKSAKDESAHFAKAVALRDESHYSVLLAQFYNPGFAQWVSLAQVFWFKAGQTAPERLFVVAERPLRIGEHFNKVTDVTALRRKLRAMEGAQLHESFKDYAADFSRRMGIENAQAIELLYQTVSMKSVGNLTEFVREHMLEGWDVESRVDEIVREFQNLNEAHEAILRAKRQIELLLPIDADCALIDEVGGQREALRACREALAPYFDQLKSVLLAERLLKRGSERERLSGIIATCKQETEELRRYDRQLELAIAEKGGHRLAEIDDEVKRHEAERARLADHADRYLALCKALEFPPHLDQDAFHSNRNAAATALVAVDEKLEATQQEKIDGAIDKRGMTDELTDLEAELLSLRSRRTNIPKQMLQLRMGLCDAIGVSEEELPFAGELLQVRESERGWEGAAERVLHNFGLSLLVPELHYKAVTHYVDKTHLRGRIVYYRAHDKVEPVRDWPGKEALVHKIEVRPDSPFRGWLERELVERFSYHCCESVDDFVRFPKALTRNGQLKSGGGRHEKDDRHAIADRSRYVLGWDNHAKIESLERRREGLSEGLVRHLQSLAALEKTLNELRTRRDTIRDLLAVDRYAELDWMSTAKLIERLQEERRRLEESADGLKTLRQELEQTRLKLIAAQTRLEEKQSEFGELKNKIATDEAELESARVSVSTLQPEDLRSRLFADLEVMRSEALGEARLTIESCNNRQKDMRGWLQGKIDSSDKQHERLVQKVVAAMGKFKNDFTVESRELDASLAAAPDYRALLLRLRGEDLPRHEERFKRMLNEGTINGIALFQNQMERERFEIEEKIRKINQSLEAIDYNPGTLIRLLAEPAIDAEVRQFRQDVRACLGDSLASRVDDLYTEEKFQQVKGLVDRFKGRDGTAEFDKRWTRKVTDVRNWFTFSASERWRADDTEKEHYQDAAGKSGGQKEKLAYTILASALAYQFGLAWGETKSRSFRFVMIDEAFGRGSDDSARYALGLFKRLNLQLLIVTPLQKIHVIEDFVRTVNFVHNPDGSNSMVRNLTIEQYREEKTAHKDKHNV